MKNLNEKLNQLRGQYKATQDEAERLEITTKVSALKKEYEAKGVECYLDNCKEQVVGDDDYFPFCCQEHKDAYWKDKPVPEVKKKLTIEQIQARLMEMAKEAHQNFDPYEFMKGQNAKEVNTQ